MRPMARTRVFLADDHDMLLDAFKRMLEPEFDVVGTARDGRELLDRAPAVRPDVIVLDVKMPLLNGLDAARRLREALPATRLIFLTSMDDPEIATEALGAGASGFLLKSSAGRELIAAIESAMQGRTYITPIIAGPLLEAARRGPDAGPELTPRQREVLQYLVQGLTMKQIAARMGITAATVAHHKYAMMEALGIESSAELIQYAVRRGLTG